MEYRIILSRTAHTIFVRRIDRFCQLLIGVEVAHHLVSHKSVDSLDENGIGSSPDPFGAGAYNLSMGALRPWGLVHKTMVRPTLLGRTTHYRES